MQLWLPSLDSKVLLIVSMKVNTLNLGWGDLSQSPIRITLLFFWATYYDIRLLFFSSQEYYWRKFLQMLPISDSREDHNTKNYICSLLFMITVYVLLFPTISYLKQ